MAYQADYRRTVGLGFEETFSEQPATSTSTMMIGGVDLGGWDWHEWALAGLAAFFLIKWLSGSVSNTLVKPIRKRRRQSRRRREARQRYESELQTIG